MKLMYLLATFAVVLVMMASCTRQSVTGYTLTAAIDGIPDGSHVQLFPVSHGHEKTGGGYYCCRWKIYI